MKLWNFLAGLLVIAAEVSSQACHLREVDLCMATGIFHYQSNGIPTDDDKINEWCDTMKEVESCMGNFTEKCASPLQREMLQLLSGSDEYGQQFCTPGSEIRAKYLEHAECLANGAGTDEFKSEMRDVQVLIEKLFEVTFQERFPLMCCGYRRFMSKVEAMTAKNCGGGAVKMIHDFMTMLTNDLPDVICKPYDPTSAQCTGLLPPPGTPAKGAGSQTQIGKMLDTVISSL